MNKPGDLARLNRHVFLSSLASLGVGLIGVLGLVFYIEPSWVGVDLVSQGMYPGEIGWLVAGIVLTCAGFAFLFISIHWSSQLKKTVFHTLPVKMVLKVEAKTDLDSTTYPETGLPVAIDYSRGILWVISGNGAVKRLPVPDV